MWVLELLRTLACFCIKFKDDFLLYFVVIFLCVLLSLPTSCLGLFPFISVHICYLFLYSYARPPVPMRPQCFWFVLFSFFSDFPSPAFLLLALLIWDFGPVDLSLNLTFSSFTCLPCLCSHLGLHYFAYLYTTDHSSASLFHH